MRLLSAIIVLLLSVASFANEVQIVKVFDGTTAYCRKTNDLFRYRNQVYSVGSVSLEQEDHQVTLSFNVIMQECVEEGGDFFFRVVNPLDDYSYDTIIGFEDHQPVWNHVTVETVDFKGIMYRDGIYKLLFRQDASHGVRLSAPVETILTNEEFEKFEAGEEIKLSIDFHLNRKVIYTSERTEREHRDMIRYGAFRFHFSVQLVNGEAVLKML